MRRLAAGALIGLLALIPAGCKNEAKPKRQTEPNPPSIGFIDSPAPESVVGPLFTVAGWALDESGVDRVRIYLDDQLVATAPLTVMRPDVDRAFSPKTGAGTPHGFSLVIDAGSRAGYCTIRAEAIDGRGALTQFATTNVKIEP
jgi:Big-like domain-containing protein